MSLVAEKQRLQSQRGRSKSLTDHPPAEGTRGGITIVICLAASASAIGLAPLAIASGYSWVQHTISESGAQGVDGAWVARLGFVLFGIAVWELAHRSAQPWGKWPTFFFRAFAVAMFAVAAFSHRPWNLESPFDATEDLLHSIAATTMGFAFIIGVAARLLSRPRDARVVRVLDLIMIAIGTAAPLGMLVQPELAGMLQRLMFIAAYLWFGHEAVMSKGHPRRAPSPSSSSVAEPLVGSGQRRIFNEEGERRTW